jgi:hypothetical protein
MIIAVDFDGTLYLAGIRGKPKINKRLLLDLSAKQRHGATVILWTCRGGKSLSEAINILYSHGFTPNFVNCNAPKAIAMMGRDSRKIYADVYIDDKNLLL